MSDKKALCPTFHSFGGQANCEEALWGFPWGAIVWRLQTFRQNSVNVPYI